MTTLMMMWTVSVKLRFLTLHRLFDRSHNIVRIIKSDLMIFIVGKSIETTTLMSWMLGVLTVVLVMVIIALLLKIWKIQRGIFEKFHICLI